MANPATERLLSLLLSHQRRMEALTAAMPPPLGLLDAHLLAEILGSGSATFLSLEHSIRVERSKLSRLAGALAKRGLLTLTPNPADRRAFILSVTAAGRREFDRNEKHMAAILDELLTTLNASERTELGDLLQALADAAGAGAHHGTAQPVLGALRRLSRASGITGGRFVDSDLSALEFQVLYVLARKGGPMRKMSLRSELPLPASTLSRTLTALAERGLIMSAPDARDQRAALAELSPAGLDKIRRAVRTLSARLRAAVSSLGADRVSRLSDLIETYAPEAPPTEAQEPPAGPVTLTTEELRERARAFIREQLISTGRVTPKEARDIEGTLIRYISGVQSPADTQKGAPSSSARSVKRRTSSRGLA